MGPPIIALALSVYKDHKYILIPCILSNQEHKEVRKSRIYGLCSAIHVRKVTLKLKYGRDSGCGK